MGGQPSATVWRMVTAEALPLVGVVVGFPALRIKGVSDLREVKLAFMEVDGEVSVIREDWAEPLRKGDITRG